MRWGKTTAKRDMTGANSFFFSTTAAGNIIGGAGKFPPAPRYLVEVTDREWLQTLSMRPIQAIFRIESSVAATAGGWSECKKSVAFCAIAAA